jgi:hypothetical protein
MPTIFCIVAAARVRPICMYATGLRALSLPVACAAALVMACAAPPALDSSSAGTESSNGLGDATIDRDVARIRAATVAFKSLDAAAAAGYEREVHHCLDNPPHGAMGYHHQNNALLDDRIELERPEILVYERLPDGEYRLNGVEYVVPFSAWPETREPPTVMGQNLKPAPTLGIWYLHVWVWTENPSGLFADWNPRVMC